MRISRIRNFDDFDFTAGIFISYTTFSKDELLQKFPAHPDNAIYELFTMSDEDINNCRRVRCRGRKCSIRQHVAIYGW